MISIVPTWGANELPPTKIPNSPGSKYALLVVIEECEVVDRQGELHDASLARLQVDSTKTFEFPHGSRDATHQVSDIKLYDFICGYFA